MSKGIRRAKHDECHIEAVHDNNINKYESMNRTRIISEQRVFVYNVCTCDLSVRLNSK